MREGPRDHPARAPRSARSGRGLALPCLWHHHTDRRLDPVPARFGLTGSHMGAPPVSGTRLQAQRRGERRMEGSSHPAAGATPLPHAVKRCTPGALPVRAAPQRGECE
jgi:hypothetical protein